MTTDRYMEYAIGSETILTQAFCKPSVVICMKPGSVMQSNAWQNLFTITTKMQALPWLCTLWSPIVMVRLSSTEIVSGCFSPSVRRLFPSTSLSSSNNPDSNALWRSSEPYGEVRRSDFWNEFLSSSTQGLGTYKTWRTTHRISSNADAELVLDEQQFAGPQSAGPC